VFFQRRESAEEETQSPGPRTVQGLDLPTGHAEGMRPHRPGLANPTLEPRPFVRRTIPMFVMPDDPLTN
jgi:hypothetical protein